MDSRGRAVLQQPPSVNMCGVHLRGVGRDICALYTVHGIARETKVQALWFPVAFTLNCDCMPAVSCVCLGCLLQVLVDFKQFGEAVADFNKAQALIPAGASARLADCCMQPLVTS